MRKTYCLYLLFIFFSMATNLEADTFISGLNDSLRYGPEIKGLFKKFELIGNKNIVYIVIFSSLLTLFINNLVYFFCFKSKIFLFYKGVILFWALSCFFWMSHDAYNFSKIGFSLSILGSSILYLLYIKELLDLKNKMVSLYKLLGYSIAILGSFCLFPLFLDKNLIYVPWFCFCLIILFLSLVFYKKDSFDNLTILVLAFSVSIIGLLGTYLFGGASILVGTTLHILILNIAPLDKKIIDLSEEVKEEKRLSNLLEDVRYGLEKSIEKRTKEVKDLLDNMNSAVFSIDKNLRVLYPISQHTEKIFNKDITGNNIYDFLFYNIRKGTKAYSDLTSCLTMVFEQDKIQFFALSEGLPNKVRLPSKDGDKVMTLKLSYSPILDKNDLVHKILCIADDVSNKEEYYLKSSDTVLNFDILKEVANIKKKGILANELKNQAEIAFHILEDFVSPLSDTYESKYFEEKLINFINNFQVHLNELPSLCIDFKRKCWEIIDIDERNIKIDPQIEATNIICDILDSLLQYQSTFSLFLKVKLKMHFKSVNFIMEKVKALETQFNNLFEYAFLVRDIKKIDDQKIGKVLHLAKLYPDFERVIDLIQQRSKLVFFLLKGMGDDESAMYFGRLSNLVKLMPEREKLNKSIIKNNLIEPYKEILIKREEIELSIMEFGKKIEESNTINKRAYFSLILQVLKRIVDENDSRLDQKIKKLPDLDPIMIDYIKSSVICLSPYEITDEFKDEAFDEINYNLERFLETLLENELEKNDALPVDKNNIKFLTFLKSLAATSVEDKKVS